jgi:hypothetical protein
VAAADEDASFATAADDDDDETRCTELARCCSITSVRAGQDPVSSATASTSCASTATGATIGASERGSKQSRPLMPETLALQQQHRADLAGRSRQRKKEYTLRLVEEHEKLLELLLSTRSSRGQNATAQLHRLDEEITRIANLPAIPSPAQVSGLKSSQSSSSSPFVPGMAAIVSAAEDDEMDDDDATVAVTGAAAAAAGGGGGGGRKSTSARATPNNEGTAHGRATPLTPTTPQQQHQQRRCRSLVPTPSPVHSPASDLSMRSPVTPTTSAMLNQLLPPPPPKIDARPPADATQRDNNSSNNNTINRSNSSCHNCRELYSPRAAWLLRWITSVSSRLRHRHSMHNARCASLFPQQQEP